MPAHIDVHVDLASLLSKFHRPLQHIMDLVSTGLNAQLDIDIDPGERWLPDADVQFSFDEEGRWSPDRVSAEFRRWILVNGFRDATETVSTFLETTRRIAAMWTIAKASGDSQLTVVDWQGAVETEGAKFHRLGLGDKLQALQSNYGIAADTDLSDRLLTINTARNCLVHRDGMVSQRELGVAAEFEVRWMRMVLVAKRDGHEREVSVESPAGPTETVSLVTKPTSKRFALGNRLAFSSAEFSQMCWTLGIFGSSLKDSLESYGIRTGVVHKPLRTGPEWLGAAVPKRP